MFVLLALALAGAQVLLVSSAVGVVAATWLGRCAGNELGRLLYLHRLAISSSFCVGG